MVLRLLNRKCGRILACKACTRACAFCNVRTGLPDALDTAEPERVAEAARRLGLKHVVITSVTRDDLADGGAEHFRQTVDAVRAATGATIEVLVPDFIGKEALTKRKEHPRRKLVGLEIDSNEAVGHGDCVHIGRAQVGVVTSSMRSPILGKNIALARVDALNAELGTEVEIGKLDGHQKRLPAKIVKFAAYDPEKTRPRS